MKKLIASLLLAGLLLSSLPLSALAAEPVPAPPPAETETLPSPEAPAAPEAPPAPAEPEAAAAPAPGESETPPAPEPPQDEMLTYVALGDSITAGVGLDDLVYLPAAIGFDMTPNYHGYSADCYVSVVAEGLGLDREHAINLGLPALMTKDMVDLLRTGAMPEMNVPAGTYYIAPEYQEYVRSADIVSVQVGCNDTMVHLMVSLGEATHWKSEKFANNLVTGGFRDLTLESFTLFMDAIEELTLTPQECSALFEALTSGMVQKCQDGYATVTQYLPEVISAIRELNPDAQILVIGYYNPVPYLCTWTSHFIKLNRFARQLCEDTGATFVPVPLTLTANDAHPTIWGHEYMGNQILRALGAK